MYILVELDSLSTMRQNFSTAPHIVAVMNSTWFWCSKEISSITHLSFPQTGGFSVQKNSHSVGNWGLTNCWKLWSLWSGCYRVKVWVVFRGKTPKSDPWGLIAWVTYHIVNSARWQWFRILLRVFIVDRNNNFVDLSRNRTGKSAINVAVTTIAFAVID